MLIFDVLFVPLQKKMGHSVEYDYKVCDIVLETFDNIPGGFVSHEQMNKASQQYSLPDHDEVYSFLVEEGLLKESKYGYEITHKGRIVIHKGGLYRQVMWESWTKFCTIVAAVAGVIAAFASLASLFF